MENTNYLLIERLKKDSSKLKIIHFTYYFLVSLGVIFTVVLNDFTLTSVFKIKNTSYFSEFTGSFFLLSAYFYTWVNPRFSHRRVILICGLLVSVGLTLLSIIF